MRFATLKNLFHSLFTKGGLDLDENVGKAEDLKESSLRRLWTRIMKTRKSGMADFALYKTSDSVSAFMVVPVSARGDCLAVPSSCDWGLKGSMLYSR